MSKTKENIISIERKSNDKTQQIEDLTRESIN